MIAPAFRKELLDKIHEGHQGITKCRERACKAVPLVAWPLQRPRGASLNLYQVLQGSKAESTAYDPITTAQVALTGGWNQSL